MRHMCVRSEAYVGHESQWGCEYESETIVIDISFVGEELLCGGFMYASGCCGLPLALVGPQPWEPDSDLFRVMIVARVS